ncbi:hypothetical protein ACFP2T_12115 [Plantactinospora solaniradicis]|uniref:DUF4352 domain-containing protein n=1 Tax=Plantactinospora solaniradicis TaxID=1723736 RepID=A0ABW1K7E0_9ACTN
MIKFVKARDADQPGPGLVDPDVAVASVQLGQGNTDIIQSGPDGPPRPPQRIAVGLALVLIVAAAMTGYLFGNRHRATTATPGTPSSSTTPVVVQPIAGTSKRCSVQLKDRLQLGVEIINQSTTTMTLRQVQAVLPLHGLRPSVTTWGSCGQLPPAASGDNYPLPAGATTWLTITFDVLVPCPGPIPVRFTVDYTQGSRSGTADLPGFPDLGDVPYTSTKCPPGSS